ncbi:hypothetical protein HBH53_144480 [Parastagonospora nodorum]|nr:hypothetical protein HBH53_144480 [Parastagonospora nodorum]KAH4003789.1 hypothetical protein HBI10_057730 [Parastagonospora nodorum]KAH4029121.1 hypothetical protein HBI13_044620 [Parastagonospora nodorum]KAH4613292.1 hypothetical protein HBH82_021510 [Parastagonospora nodorum]KAH4782133.1 hypothetical protein HBH62_115420 [Parastagonospora nodorum]
MELGTVRYPSAPYFSSMIYPIEPVASSLLVILFLLYNNFLKAVIASSISSSLRNLVRTISITRYFPMDSNTTVSHSGWATMDVEKLAGLAYTFQTITIASLVFVVLTYAPKLMRRLQLAKLPSMPGKDYATSARKLYKEGHQKFKDTVYFMSSDGEHSVVVPPHFLPELRKLPDDVLSFAAAIDNVMETKFTGVDSEDSNTVHTIKSDLTPALPRLNQAVCTEVDAAMREALPSCEDWTEVDINDKLLDIISKVSGRVFVGPDLCHDPEYLELGRNYTVYLMEALFAIKRTRPWLKSFVGHRLPEVKRLRDVEKKAIKFVQPIVRERLEAEKSDPNWQKPDDMMQWLINRYNKDGHVSVEHIAKCQLGLILAASHTTTMTTTNILYTLVSTPEYVEPLREEIRNAMHRNGGSITTRALQEMVKLDSYMKEVLRLYPAGLSSFSRRVMKGITLSNGQYLPPGATVQVPTAAIYTDSENYPDPDTFDGFRHSKLREGGTATDHSRNQFVTTNETNLGFGYGRHACPGRFFAANEIKMIVARLILNYDMKMPGDATERYPNVDIGRSCIPCPGKTLMFKRV